MEKDVRSDCDRIVPSRLKGKLYVVAVRPAMLYVLETVTLPKRQDADIGGRGKDVTIFTRINNHGQDQECVHQRYSTGCTI